MHYVGRFVTQETAVSPLSRVIFTNVLEPLYRKTNVVMYKCATFSLRRKVAPLQNIKFHNADLFNLFISGSARICCEGYSISKPWHWSSGVRGEGMEWAGCAK